MDESMKSGQNPARNPDNGSEIERLTRENTFLRVNQKACPYGNQNADGGCKLGYPGCSCMDDLIVFDEEYKKHLQDQINSKNVEIEELNRQVELRTKQFTEASASIDIMVGTLTKIVETFLGVNNLSFDELEKAANHCLVLADNTRLMGPITTFRFYIAREQVIEAAKELNFLIDLHEDFWQGYHYEKIEKFDNALEALKALEDGK